MRSYFVYQTLNTLFVVVCIRETLKPRAHSKSQPKGQVGGDPNDDNDDVPGAYISSIPPLKTEGREKEEKHQLRENEGGPWVGYVPLSLFPYLIPEKLLAHATWRAVGPAHRPSLHGCKGRSIF
jgi:hypothetical protein